MKIIAFVDGSDYLESVCAHAAWAAERGSGSVEVFHMLGRRERPSAPADLSGNLNLGARSALLDKLSRADSKRAKLAQERGRLILEDARARIARDGAIPVETRMRNDDIVETVREYETGAELVVVGKRGEASAFAREHLGSNLERILRSAQKPVLVASLAFREIARVLVAFDGGPSVTRAVAHMAREPLFAGLSFHLLHAGEESEDMRARIDAAAGVLERGGRAVAVEFRPGEPADIVADAVGQQGFDMLVTGAYGHSRIRTLIIGSTTTELVRACRVPVLMVR